MLLDEVCDRFKTMWSLNQQVTVDESIVMYKGKYLPIQQYMPNKPVRFDLKVWSVVDALSKYVWNFQVYCGKFGNPHNDYSGSDCSDDDDNQGTDFPDSSGKGEGLQGRNVVKDLLADLGGKGHIVTMDNFFTSVPLFLDLQNRGIMAMGTLRANRKYVPCFLYAKEATKKKDYG